METTSVAGSVAVYYRTKEAFLRSPLPKAYPDEGIDKDDYEFVARIPNAPSLEEVFRMMNVVDGDELAVQLKVRSMSVGDIIVDEDGDVWFCGMTGWMQVSW